MYETCAWPLTWWASPRTGLVLLVFPFSASLLSSRPLDPFYFVVTWLRNIVSFVNSVGASFLNFRILSSSPPISFSLLLPG